MRESLGYPMKDSKILKSPTKRKDDTLIEEVNTLLESPTAIKKSEFNTKISDISKDIQSELDVDQPRILEEEHCMLIP